MLKCPSEIKAISEWPVACGQLLDELCGSCLPYGNAVFALWKISQAVAVIANSPIRKLLPSDLDATK